MKYTFSNMWCWICLPTFSYQFALSRVTWSKIEPDADCTLFLSAFGESLGRELPKMRLGKCDSLHSCRELSILGATRGDSQVRHETLWLMHHGPLKRRNLNNARHEHRGYTRGSKARRVFQSTFSLSPCLGFPRQECTAGMRFKPRVHYYSDNVTGLSKYYHNSLTLTRVTVYIRLHYLSESQGYYTARFARFGRRTAMWYHWMAVLCTFHLGSGFHIQFRAQHCQKYASHEKSFK